METIWYFVQVSVCITIFYFLYQVLFKNTTFYLLNRFYLLTCLAIAFVIPVSSTSVVPVDYHNFTSDLKAVSVIGDLQHTSNVSIANSPSISYSLVLILYWIGFVYYTFRLVHSLTSVLRLSRANSFELEHNVFYTDANEPYSFFNRIFLPKGGVDPLILEHEKAHVAQYHWIDLLLLEIVGVLLWFNPIMIFYRRSLKIQHEYAADDYALRKATSTETYLDCIVRHLYANSFPGPVSNFYSKHIKQRIFMMTKQKTSFSFAAVYILIAPVLCLLLIAFSKAHVSVYNGTDVSGEIERVIIVDAAHGGDDAGAISANGVNEKDLVLSIAKHIQKAAAKKNIKVILTRGGDQGVELEKRVTYSNIHKAELFISLHANFNSENSLLSGLECVVSESNIGFDDSKRFAESLTKELVALGGIPVNDIRQSNFYVLSKNKVPAIVLQLGFLSNITDTEYVMDEANQQRISERIISAIVNSSK